MASNKDLEISSISYTNKDFASIYPDMLDLAKKITNRWDPSQSNESDPGVVLIKEAAFVADHNNYNIDKNILENFLPSATQDKSVRNICEMNGYTPRYYVAATGEIVMYYTFSDPDTKRSFNVPKFTYVISNEDETVSYTQLTDLQIIASDTGNDSIQATCKFIEGTLQTLTVNDSSTITMENLDDNNRVYLPEVMVAQNGVFVKNVNQEDYNDYWERDNYLLTQPSGSRKFKLDYDSDMMLPYLEFPSDISNLIGDGIQVQYISTSGEAGNVSAGTLTKIISPTELNITDSADGSIIQVLSSNFELNNLGSISNGKNPETIDEMYQSFRKTVGTFETLISCLDYSNYIFNMEDDNGSSLVSNVYVTDRRTDYNKACNVVTFDDSGIFFKNISIKPCSLSFKGVVSSKPTSGENGDLIVYEGDLYVYSNSDWLVANTINLNDFTLLSQAMTPYDLAVYALKTFAISDYIRKEPSYAFNESFKPVSSDTYNQIISEVDDVKCISHTFKSATQDDVFCFKNYEPLKIVITPYSVIETHTEGDDIINNVNIAISKNFNPRHLNFGEDLNLTDVKKVIIDCDDRIKDVDITKLYETDIRTFTKAMDYVGDNYDIDKPFYTTSTSTLLVDLIAKNVLAGRVCLFNFDNSFSMTYGQSDGKIINNVSSIVTEVPIQVNKSNNSSSGSGNINVQSYEYTSNGKDLWYIFNAPLFADPITQERINLSNNMKCTLKISNDRKIYDKLTLYQFNPQSGNLEEVTYASQDGVEVEITVLFNDGSSFLLNEKRKLPKELTDDFLVPEGTVHIDVKTTVSTTESGSINVDYTLKDNENVQIIYPNYYSDKSYGMYVNYRFISTTGTVIRANTEHVLKSNEKMVFVYTSDGVVTQDVYDVGTVINSSFDLAVTDDLSSSGVKKDWVDNNGFLHQNEKFRTLASNQTIATRKSMETVLSNSVVKCYWIMNNQDNVLKFEDNDDHTEHILRDNEYFIYTNNTFSEMMILGSGTLLKKSLNDPNGEWSISSNNTTIESITENGISSNIPWQSMDFSNSPFTIIEMNVVTLSSGDSFTISSWDDVDKDSEGNPLPINNEWRFCNGNITYTIGDKDKTILPKVEDFYRMRSRLNLIISSSQSQELQSVQTVTVNGEKITAPYKLQCNKTLSTIGGEIDIGTDNDVKIYRYRDDLEEVSSTSILISTDSEGIYPFFFDNSIGTYLIPVYVSGSNEGIKDAEIIAEMYDSSGEVVTLSDYNNTDYEEKISLKGNTLYLLSPNNSVDTGELYLKLSGWVPGSPYIDNEIAVLVSDFKIVKNGTDGKAVLNDLISIHIDNPDSSTPMSLDDILKRMKEIIDGSDHPSLKPYYIYEPDNTSKINLERYCNKISTASGVVYKNKAFDNQEIMWDINNVANHMTIPQIDLDSSMIEINSVLRRY